MAPIDQFQESMPCRHCGRTVRPGMIRCRECNGLLADTNDEFVVAPQVTIVEAAKCPRCGSPFESGSFDCATCAGALLDDLLKGPEAAHVPVTSNSSSSLRPREPGTASTSSNEWVPLREVPTPPPQSRSGKSNSAANTDGKAGKSPRKKGKRSSAEIAARGEKSADETTVETSAACAALLASLATADALLRIEIATALGKLGDKAAIEPLERHMVDPDVAVRRAVASALAQLGHPMGQSLLDVAERTPAAQILSVPRQPKRKGAGFKIEGAVLKKIGLAVVACAVIAGGIGLIRQTGAGAGTQRGRKLKKRKTAAVQVSPRMILASLKPLPISSAGDRLSLFAADRVS